MCVWHVQTEAAALAERRLRERARVIALDSYTNTEEDTRWFIISDSWLQKWRAFIDNCACVLTGPLHGLSFCVCICGTRAVPFVSLACTCARVRECPFVCALVGLCACAHV